MNVGDWDKTDSELIAGLGGNTSGLLSKTVVQGSYDYAVLVNYKDKWEKRGERIALPGAGPLAIGETNVTSMESNFKGSIKIKIIDLEVGITYTTSKTYTFSKSVGTGDQTDPFTYRGIGFQKIRYLQSPGFYGRRPSNSGESFDFKEQKLSSPLIINTDKFGEGITKKCN